MHPSLVLSSKEQPSRLLLPIVYLVLLQACCSTKANHVNTGRLSGSVLDAGGTTVRLPDPRTIEPTTHTITADVDMPPESEAQRYAVASFRLWYPQGVDAVRAIVVLVPGSNNDGRAAVDSADWQAFANKNKLALIGCYFKDRQPLSDEDYAQAINGSGDALLKALVKFSQLTGRTELADAKLLLWGFSAGGEFNYDFSCFRPDRVIGFVVNKGGYYHTVAPGATKVPGLMYVGGKDATWRIANIRNVYETGRASEEPAPWALVMEATRNHEIGDSGGLSKQFFQALLTLRLPTNGGELRPIDQTHGYTCNLDRLKCVIAAMVSLDTTERKRTAWLPDLQTATEWQRIVNLK